MKKIFPILLALLALAASTLACSLTEMSLENGRMAHDQDGKDVTSTFSTSDVFYVVSELNNAPKDTAVDAKWVAVNVEGYDPNFQFQEQTYTVVDDNFTGTVYFQLSNDNGWPIGDYKVDLYLNGEMKQSVTFNVE